MNSYIKGRGTEVPIIIMYGLNHREQETKKETEQRRQQKENKQKKNRIKNRKRAKKKQNGAKKQRSKRQKTKADSLFLVRLSFSHAHFHFLLSIFSFSSYTGPPFAQLSLGYSQVRRAFDKF